MHESAGTCSELFPLICYHAHALLYVHAVHAPHVPSTRSFPRSALAQISFSCTQLTSHSFLQVSSSLWIDLSPLPPLRMPQYLVSKPARGGKSETISHFLAWPAKMRRNLIFAYLLHLLRARDARKLPNGFDFLAFVSVVCSWFVCHILHGWGHEKHVAGTVYNINYEK